MQSSNNLGLIEGETAPDFSFFDLEDQKSLSSFRGKYVVIYFYPRDFTPGCTTEASEFSKDFRKFIDKDAIIIGVSPDDEKSHNRFKEKMNIPFMLASDKNNEISKKYKVYGLKKFMGKEYLGVTRTTFLVDKNGKIKKIFRNVKPNGHSVEVLESI